MYTVRVSFIRKYPLAAVGICLALVCALVWSAVYAQESRAGAVTFAVLDIGQGDALFIQGPTGIQVLVDAGPNTGAVLRALPTVMPWWDRTLDVAIETHPDADHMGGMLDVFERYKVGAFVTPGIVKRNTLTDALGRAVDRERSLIFVARRGMVVDLGGGAHLNLLYPDTNVAGWENRSNDGSVVAQLVYGSTTVMLTGDATFETEERLLALGGPLKSDILKVGHHGSRTSTSEEFLQAVEPNLALVSVGAKNNYGHPAPDVLERLRAARVPLMRTDQDGAIICTLTVSAYSCE